MWQEHRSVLQSAHRWSQAKGQLLAGMDAARALKPGYKPLWGIKSWMTSTWKFFRIEGRGFHSADCLGRLSSLFSPVIFPSLYQVLAPSLLFLMQAMWAGELCCSKYYLGTMSLCIASICHSSGHKLPKEPYFSC